MLNINPLPPRGFMSFYKSRFLTAYEAPRVVANALLPITNEEARQNLILEYQRTNDPKLMDKIIRTNIRLVFRCIRKWMRSVADEDDLLSEGVIGLMRAVKDFDKSKDTTFSTYAFQWINCKLQRYCQEHNNLTTVRRPCWKFTGVYWEELNDSRDLSLDDVVNDDDGTVSNQRKRKDFLLDDRPLADEEVNRLQCDKEAKKKLNELFEQLYPEERYVMELRYKENMTLEAIAQKLRGITRERVRQIEHNAVVRLAKKLEISRPIKDVHGSLFEWFHDDRVLDPNPGHARKVKNSI